jgi:hypothetical protein
VRNAQTVLVPQPEWKRPLGINMCRWQDNIKK